MTIRRGPGADAFATLAAGRWSRRHLLLGGLTLAAGAALPATVRATTPGPAALLPTREDALVVAPGLKAERIVGWGDPLFRDAPALDTRAVVRGALLAQRPGLAGRQFGYNCDAVHFFGTDPQGTTGLLCVNNEYPSPELMFPGLGDYTYDDASSLEPIVRRHPGIVALMQLSVGVSITGAAQDGAGRWRHAALVPQARRITAQSPCEITGPARGHRLLRTRDDTSGTRVLGTFANCAAGQTPWGTYLTAEENVDEYFANASALASTDAQVREAHRRFPLLERSVYGWEFVDPRFDVAREPTEPLRHGWIVEIDPFDPTSTPRKRTALGRFSHECAAAAPARDGRVAFYMGDDDRFEYLYKFVTARPMHPTDRAANRDLLDAGVLYVARFDGDGTGRWLPLVHGTGPLTAANGFDSQGDVVIRARAAADLVGATPMDRPEDVAPDATTGRVYVSMTNNVSRKAGSVIGQYNGRDIDLGPDAANPRGPNRYGHVLQLDEESADTAATAFQWRLLFEGGGAIGSPDNLALDAARRLWVVSDGAQPQGTNNGCFVVQTEGPARGQVRQVLSAPVGAEVCGCEFAPDGRALFLAIQHPGEYGSLEAPTSRWPHGEGHAPVPTVVALRREDGGPLSEY